MFKVMLIDDYVPALKYLESLVCWEQQELKVVARASSSAKALEEFRNTLPDLVISDIGIPQRNGLELAEQFKQIKPEVRLIFLTCHEDFGFAKRAFEVNADDYLIKDELTADGMINSLRKSVFSLKTMDEYVQRKSNNQVLHRNLDLLKQSYLQQWMAGKRAQELADFGRRIGIDWPFSQYMMIAARVDFAALLRHYAYEDLPVLNYGLYNIAQDVARQFEARHPVVRLTPFLLTAGFDNQRQISLRVIVNYNPRLDRDVRDVIRSMLYEWSNCVKRFLQIDVIATVSPGFAAMGSIGSVCRDVRRFRMRRYYDGSHIEWMEYAVQEKTDFVEESEALIEQREGMQSALRNADLSSVRRLAERFAVDAARFRLAPSLFIDTVRSWLRALEAEARLKIPQGFYALLDSTLKVGETLELFYHQLKSGAPDKRHAASAGASTPKLQQIDRYISQHLEENITSVSVAQYLYLNPSYFSRYFKKMTGENFIDYVHRYKMEIACRMLKNRHRTIETIGMNLGYCDRTYFSRVFKKYKGVSPSDFRSRWDA